MTRRSRSVGASAQGQVVCLLALIVCFAVGVLLGSCFARLGGSAGWTQLSACVQRCMDAERPGLISVLSVTVRYPLLLVLSGLTLWGAWAAPAILMARGFFSRLYGVLLRPGLWGRRVRAQLDAGVVPWPTAALVAVLAGAVVYGADAGKEI